MLHLPVSEHAAVEQSELGGWSLGCLLGGCHRTQHRSLVERREGVKTHHASEHRMDLKYCELISKAAIYFC